jgi:hypothetical protein
METTWAARVSSGVTGDALTDGRSLEGTLDVKTGRHDTLKVAERCAAERGAEHWSCLEGCRRDWRHRPLPDGPITGGLDGGDGRNGEAKPQNVAVLVGTRPLACTRDDAQEPPSRTRVGCGPSVAPKPTRRLDERVHSPGCQLNPQRTC